MHVKRQFAVELGAAGRFDVVESVVTDVDGAEHRREGRVDGVCCTN